MNIREASSLDLFTDSVRIMGDATLCAVMEFHSRLDPGLLQDAAEACVQAHPILHSRLVRGLGPAFWEKVEPVFAPLRVEPCPEDYHPRVIGPVDPYGPLQCRIRLLRRPSGDVIVVNLAHAAADGFGLQVLSSQILTEYMSPGSVPREGGEIPERDTLWTRDLAGEAGGGDEELTVINPMWPDPFGTSEENSSYHRTHVPPESLEGIRGRVRREGGNLNDAVLAAYYLAMSDLTGCCEPIPVFFPVNLRQHLQDGSRVMSNQATNVCVSLDRDPGDDMEDILPRVIEKTRDLKAHGIGIAEQVRMDTNSDPEGRYIHQMVQQMADLQKAGLADIFFSNPGAISLPDLEGLDDAYFCYPGGYMPTTCFITTTFRGRMTVTMGYQDSERPRSGTGKAMSLFTHHLMELVS